METATESPILWYHDRYVDFGSIQDAINDKAPERMVTFEFSVRLPQSAGLAIGEPIFDVTMTLAEGAPPQGAYVHSYQIRCEGHDAALRFTHLGKLLDFKVNGADVLPSGTEMSLSGPAYLLSTLHPGAHGRVTYQPVLHSIRLDPPQYRDPDSEPLLTELGRELRSILHGSTADDTLARIGDRLLLGPRDAMWSNLKKAVHGRRVEKQFAAKGEKSAKFTAIINRVLARLVPWILDAVDQQVAEFMYHVAYLGPLRATGQRSYRLQDISVSDVDPDGQNLAMFIRSLSASELDSFAAFTAEHLGFESKILPLGLNAEIQVKERGSSRHRNLVDIGFGYTEVLPLTAILWSTCVRSPEASRRRGSLLAVEQPELHLHPAYQAKLARMFVSAMLESRKAGREVKIMLETHSEGLISGIGELIHDKVIPADDVQILFFDQDEETREISVRFAGYDEQGALTGDWPFGFSSGRGPDRRGPLHGDGGGARRSKELACPDLV